MKTDSRHFVIKLCLFFLCLFHVSTTLSQPTQKHTTKTQTPSGAAIATAHPYATDAGEEILRAGGNAFDAAVAITAALAVVEPYGSGLGGGGFWLLHRAENGRQTMVDGREVAPSSASKNMYLDKHGDVVKGASINGPKAAGIPGVPAGLEYLAKRYGRLSLKETLAPAIRIAEQGFPVTERYQKLASYRLPVMQSFPSTAAIFLEENRIPDLGYNIIQTDLAETLKKIAAHGAAYFYT
ncbi:MAG: gamma-glutamyltransferase, partial [Gammaproteobacteria bacterium]|nr:gamma-glutamyltransferase [Gammaproteobacteria bacterium]